jgi:hypothetical protein
MVEPISIVESNLTIATNILSNMPLINNFLLILFIVYFGIVFMVASRNPKNPVDWIDLIIDPTTNKISTTKLGQFWGIAISSWVVITLTQVKESYPYFSMIFFGYLAFLGGSYAFQKWFQNKKDDEKEDPK